MRATAGSSISTSSWKLINKQEVFLQTKLANSLKLSENQRIVENIIIYEQPLNERIRNFIRLEHLFQQAYYTLRGYSIWDSRATIRSVTDILDILSRSDLKTELLKELERHQSSLSKLKNIPGVDTEQLDSILTQLTSSQNELLGITGQLGQRLRDHDLLSSLRQRSTVAGGSCPVDMPVYHHWLQQPPEERINILENWLDELSPVNRPITLMLGIIRESTHLQETTAEKGFYQQNLDTNAPVQLIRVALNQQSPYFAEISGGKHRFSVRFMKSQDNNRPVQSQDDIKFKLGCCVI
jgi:cell division protein ZapD